MTRKRPSAELGSEKWIQLAVNDFPGVLYDHVAPKLHSRPSRITWSSPLRNDEFREYSDHDFINLLGLELENHSLERFWSSGGPNWDGLAKTDISQVLLVEAKAQVREIKEKGSGASNEQPIARIDRSLKQTQKFHGVGTLVDWSKYPYYQYANRLAHLYLLSERNRIDAYLLMFYFLNDVPMGGPNSTDLWEAAIQRLHVDMGLCEDHRLSDRIINLYLDVRVFGE